MKAGKMAVFAQDMKPKGRTLQNTFPEHSDGLHAKASSSLKYCKGTNTPHF